MKQKKALVIGLGISGRGAAELLLRKGFCVVAADRNAATLMDSTEVRPLMDRGLRIVSDDADSPLEEISLAVVSPGVEPSHPLIARLKHLKVEVISEIELAFQHLPNTRILAVTGTNGKTTTVLLTVHILNQSGIKAVALGNVGAALSAYAANPDSQEVLVVELSSFQLEMLQQRPRLDAAAILNITPNHLNRHASMDEYARAKLRIASCLKPNGELFVSRAVIDAYADLSNLPFAVNIFDRQPFFDLENRNVRSGMPEMPNIQAAFALSFFCNVSEVQALRALASFRKPVHRIEWVAEIDGVAYYNDSKASNVDAVVHAMQLFSGPVILMAGGVHKGFSYKPWISSFGNKVKQLVAFGEAAPLMQRELGSSFPVQQAAHLQEALAIARASAAPGDTVLFSPGCSSYDQFLNYEQRGDAFKQLILRAQGPVRVR